VTSGRQEQSSPSLSALCGHPRHCSAMLGTATTPPTLLGRTGMGRRHACHCASYGPPSMAPSSRPADSVHTASLYTTTLEAAPVQAQDKTRRPDWSKICQDGRQLRGTARHASTCRRIVWHICKLPSPWPIKGGVIPQPRGTTDRDDRHTHTPFALAMILALASINISGTWRPSLLSRQACSPPLQAPWCNAIQCPEHATAGCTAPAGTRIKPSVISCQHRTIERLISALITS
jgi:hypothetical protein